MANIVEKIKEEIKEVAEKVEDKVEEVVEEVKEVFEGKEKSKKETSKKSEKKKGSKKDVSKKAEAESIDTTETDKSKEKEESKSIEERKKELLEKAKALSEKVDVTTSEELKEQVKVKKRTDMLIPLEEYVKAGIYLGTKVVTPAMKKYVYRRRADGLAIFNTNIIDEKLKEGIEYLSKFDKEDIILVCKRPAGWKGAKMFSELTGIRVFTKKYPAGVLTNTNLPDFFENELTIITDSWLDKNALNDTIKVKKKVLMICDTNNFAKGADQIIIGNNKSPKSLGVIFYLLTRGYLKAKGEDTTKVPDLDWWVEEEK